MKRWGTLLFAFLFFVTMGMIAAYLGLVAATGFGARVSMLNALCWATIAATFCIPSLAVSYYNGTERFEALASRLSPVCILAIIASLAYAVHLVWGYEFLWMMVLVVYASEAMLLWVVALAINEFFNRFSRYRDRLRSLE